SRKLVNCGCNVGKSASHAGLTRWDGTLFRWLLNMQRKEPCRACVNRSCQQIQVTVQRPTWELVGELKVDSVAGGTEIVDQLCTVIPPRPTANRSDATIVGSRLG